MLFCLIKLIEVWLKNSFIEFNDYNNGHLTRFGGLLNDKLRRVHLTYQSFFVYWIFYTKLSTLNKKKGWESRIDEGKKTLRNSILNKSFSVTSATRLTLNT